MKNELYSVKPYYEMRELSEDEKRQYDEIYCKVKQITDKRNFDFTNPFDQKYYVEKVIDLVDNNSNFRVVNLTVNDRVNIKLTLEPKPVIIPFIEVSTIKEEAH